MRVNDVAIVGISCRLPGARDHREFWNNVAHGRSSVGEVPPDRWDWAAHGADRGVSRWGGFLTDVDAFDAAFFRLSPLELESTDPQQRITLELAWSCLEDAAIRPSDLAGRDVGVFLGTFNLDFKDLQERTLPEVPAHHSTGTANAVIANRVSHFFDFHGPSVVVDTASSASLQALHLAVQSLNTGECQLALAGGINLLLTPDRHVSFSKTKMLSPTGSCKAFDARADGYARGEGGGLVLLKPLADALRDGDDVYAVIRGTAANHSGRTRTLTHPDEHAQARVVADALRRAEVSPDTVSYVEAHGTGTPTGDPVEVRGLIEGFRLAGGTDLPGTCGLGSVKTNIGHLESAAGIAGLLKVVLAMKHRRLPALLNFTTLNPRIALDGTPFYVVDSARDWVPTTTESGDVPPLRAGVSSFGFGGTNAHAVLEEGPRPAQAPSESAPAYLVCLSARTEESLAGRIRDLREWLAEQGQDADLAALSATLLLGRECFDRRVALVVGSADELASRLAELAEGALPENCFTGQVGNSDPLPEDGPDTGFHFGDQVAEAEYTRHLVALAKRFVAGADLPWEQRFADPRPRRLHLPTYAFTRQRYWITADPAAAAARAPKTDRTRGHGNLVGIEEGVEQDLRDIATRVLKLPQGTIHPDDRMADHGFDSVANTALALEIGERYGIELTPELLYTHFTLGKLKDHLIGDHRDAVERVHGTATPARGPVVSVEAAARPAPRQDTAEVGEDIAIIGMSGRFPGARTVDELWTAFAEGWDVTGPIPADRLAAWRRFAGVDAATAKGGWLPGVDEFDPLFFEISPKEAETMDPRQRLLLQESWRALEDAGYGPNAVRANRMGMFVGAEQGDYHRLTGDAETLTSGHDGILASRLGYFLNFSGPVLAVNTACSAGLVALRQACLSLRAGECDTALAAAVNVMATPQFFKHATQAGMLADDGVCRAFDKRATGMVMAEAVAVVVLKPLAKALADGDRVNAVIKAVGINYDGRTNGITAPSQTAQADLLRATYAGADVDPAEVGLVVAHGTGTRLGDPIEVNALAEVYGEHSAATQYCALTSTKPNVGHTLAASGLVSLIGLVQAMRHETIPASLHCEQDSDYIDWTGSPFYVNKQARPWPAVPGRTRTGAVSSFGISGTNAHVVVEAYDADPDQVDVHSGQPTLLTLSAKTDEALTARLAELLAFLRSRVAGQVDLPRISATLLTGRHHFAHRCALVVTSHEEAEHLLGQVLAGEKVTRAVRGHVARDFRPQPLLAEYGHELVARLADTRDADPRDEGDRRHELIQAVADLYCQGYDLPWADLYGDRKPICAPLPTYPFAREHYWVEPNTLALGAGQSALHPLLDRNVSTLGAQKYTKRLSSDEFFLRDHVVGGKILLPGVAHLEMAHSAARLATGADVVTLHDVIWGHPVVMEGDTKTVDIGLSAVRDDTLDYLIHQEIDGKRTVFSQGRATYGAHQPQHERATIDIPAITARCTRRRDNAELYPYFLGLGFGYGPTFQAIETLHCGETEALARIVLDDSLTGEFAHFTLHPSLFDAVLNTLRGIGAQDDVLRIPFSLESLVVFGPIPRVSYCHGTIHRIARDGSISVNLSVCDENGLEFVRAVGLVFKAFNADKDADLHYYVPRWDKRPADVAAGASERWPLLVLDDDESRASRLRAVHTGRVVHVRTGTAFEDLGGDRYLVDPRSQAGFDLLLSTLSERGELPRAVVNLWTLAPAGAELTEGLDCLLHLFRAAHGVGLDHEVTHLSVVPRAGGAAQAAAESLSGFARAMTPVNHLFRMNSLHVDAAMDVDAIVGAVLGELRMAEDATALGGHEVRVAGGVREERVIRRWTGGGTTASSLPFKEKGVYLISGGAGKLGLHFGRYLAGECRARLVLLGRRAPDAQRREQLAALEAAGAEVLHLVCDVTDREDVRRALDTVRERFGGLDGVVHSAGVAGSTGVLDAGQAEFDAVLAPKVRGTVHLDELTKDEALDFFVLFSSISAEVGDFGQGSYAAANRFLDGYAHHREQLRAAGQRRGRSVSINWPYWAEGGMLGDLEHDGVARTLYHDYSGMRALKTDEGMRAFTTVLASGETQVIVTKGQQRKIEKVLRVATPAPKQIAPAPAPVVAAARVRRPERVDVVLPAQAPVAGDFYAKTVEYLKGRLSEVFKLPKGRIDPAAELGEYGIESIQIMELMRLLGKDFESIPGTLFFEYRTVGELAQYFVDDHAERLAELLGVDAGAAVVVAPVVAAPVEVPVVVAAEPVVADTYARTVEYLKGRLSEVFKLPKGRIDPAAELGEYGIESIQIMELMRLLGKDFESIPGTLFFEYRTLNELGQYFVDNQADRLRTLLGTGAPATQPAVRPAAPVAVTTVTAPAPAAVAAPAPARAEGRCRDVAVIGMSGRYPGARDVDEFWTVLAGGEDRIEEIPSHRWDKHAHYDAEKKPGKTYSKWGGFIDGAEDFDALFFAMSPNQAALADPQGRLFLQSAWEAMEDAGYTRATLVPDRARKVGVYLGMMWNEYQLYSTDEMVLSDRAAAANAVSYFFDLHGQSLTVDTACSSSLYAIAMAVEAIRAGTTSLAFAGGANLSLHPNKYVSLSQMNFFSTDGRCRSFGAGGTGYVPGEGVGCVLLKPLDQAVADGDHIHGVIRGVATDHGGKTNGLTVPNPVQQGEMVAAALADAGISAEDVSYIEGHGTGTPLGDPIEITGLTRAFRKHTKANQFCPVGSVKSNVGHLEGAAGIVAVTKVLLQLKHGMLAPSLHSAELNPYIDFSTTPFYVQRELGPWERRTRVVDGQTQVVPRIAGVSSFGAHGAIAHLIIQEHIAEDDGARAALAPAPELIVLSAKNADRLREQARRLSAWVSGPGRDAELADIAHSLQLGREAMEERLAVIVESTDALREKLDAFLGGDSDVEDLFLGQVRDNKDTIALFAGDDEMRDAVAKWIARGKFDKVADLWVKGLVVDWSLLVRPAAPRRISLPTYPFARERHWLAPASAPVPVVAPVAVLDDEPVVSMAFTESWEPAPLAAAASSPLGGVVCLCTGTAAQSEVERAVLELDPTATVAFIGQGEDYRKTGPSSYEVRRGEAGDYLAALTDLAATGTVDVLLDLWGLEPGAPRGDHADVVHTLKAVAGAKVSARRLMLGGQFHDGVERAHLEAAIGFERSLGLVLPQLSVAMILQDAADPARPAGLGEWAKLLLAEARQDKAGAALYRAGVRHVQRVRPVALTEGGDALKRGGTYLVTGGAGGLGLLVAGHLAEHYDANLVLTGRSPLTGAIEEKLRGLDAARTLYVRADVADAESMRRAVGAARDRFGVLHGVVHAAGVQGQGTVLDNDLGEFASVLAPKVAGTLVLDEVLAGEDLDFVCYFSSTSAVLGDFGGCGYAVGNRFQMAYGAHRADEVRAGRARGKTVVVNWPLWREGGMGFDADMTTMYLRSSGQDYLESADGLALFERLLAQDATQHLVVVGKPARVGRFLGLAAPVAAPAPAPVAVPQASGLPIEERLDHDLRALVSGVLNIAADRLYDDDNLADYGFDSVSLTSLGARMSGHFGIEVTPAVFYGQSTLRRLRTWLAQEHAARVADLYNGPAAAEVSPPVVPAAPPVPIAIAAAAPRPISVPVPAAAAPVSTHREPADDAIAIVGMSGRFPGARTVDELWSVLAQGRDVVDTVSAERLALWGESATGEYAGVRFGQLPGPAEFDPLFFEISPKEARTIDPRQRLLLQESWRALEDAGWWGARTGRAGMFVGVEQGDYADLLGGEDSVTANHDGILAARLAYHLDFAGPVMAINTACSSGLVAVHQACAAIRAGECDTAMAAAVSVVTTPQLFRNTTQAGMLSEDGVCYAFDKRANGMVIGEAVAVVVLKRLSDALADGDRVHAVIRGSGVNYDGRSNGITAPNGPSQVDLLTSVHARHGIDPADIDHVVAHGTGTRLGDPVEVNALNEAFKRRTAKTGYCALTSTKANVGHTLAASGIVSLIGVVQALRNETIPASLHCEQASDYISWADSPFVVNRTNRPWPADRTRTAAVSSFGMSGTNAHLVLESAPSQVDNGASAPVHLLALSAKTEDSLRGRVDDLIALLDNQDRPSLRAISATLLDGLAHFPHRAAVVAGDAAEARDLLRGLARGDRGDGRSTGVAPKGFAPDAAATRAAEDLLRTAESAEEAILRQALHGLADLYCQGHDLAWRRLFGGRRVPPVSLPGYPFARKHYWPAAAVVTEGHPFLRSGESGTTFTGSEFFLRDHVVAGEKVFPGVGHLELARVAGSDVRAIRDIVWLRPATAGEGPLSVRVAFDGDRYQVVAGSDAVSQGRVVTGTASPGATLDLDRLRADCGLYDMDPAEAYAAYRRKGIEYGPAFRGLDRIHVGDGQVLAKIVLPAEVAHTLGQFGLHPSLLDAALQASIGVLRATTETYLPYALEELEILGPCAPEMWAWVRRSANADTTAPSEKLDIDLCDDRGEVRVRVRSFSVRPLGRGRTAPADAGATTLLAPRWVEASVDPAPIPAGRVLLVGDDPAALGSVLAESDDVEVLLLRAADTVDGLVARLGRGAAYDQVVWIAGGPAPSGPGDDTLLSRQETGLYAGFRLVKALLALGYDRRELDWTVVTVGSQAVDAGDPVDPAHAGVPGLIGSVAKETTSWRVRLADLDRLDDPSVRAAMGLRAERDGALWARRGERWLRQSLQPVDAGSGAAPYRHGGVYVVVGGAGGLGAAWTEHLVRDYGAHVVWIGRRAEDDTVRARIAELAAVGPAPWYLRADAADRDSLAAAFRQIKTRHPHVHGVVHSAIALLDDTAARMTEERFRAAVRAKADISVRIAQVFADEPLDFVLFFSALNSFLRSPGQSNYVAGCLFKDAFARLLATALPCPVKVMNWGFWGSVGVVAAERYRRRMAKEGIGSIEPAEGMAALDALLAGPFDQLALRKATEVEVSSDDVPPADERQLRRVVADSGPARGYDDALLCELLITQLREVGLAERGSLADLRATVAPAGHGRWLDETAGFLAEHGYLKTDGDRYTLTASAPLDGAATWRRWDEVRLRAAGRNPYVTLLDRAVRECPQVLTGRTPATAVLFPDSSMALVEGIYRTCESADALNEIVADQVAARVKTLLRREPGKRIRVLEIGAGTGGTSAKVLDRLAAHADSIEEYRYTDVSQSFLLKGKREFAAAHPYLRCSLFDVERDPVEQGLDLGAYDLILAVNVLHATRDIRVSVRHARSLLGADGMLVVNELAANSLFLHLTFGLLDGWWRYEDPELRLPRCPGLAPATWRSVLREEGFAAIDFPAAKVHDLGHQIVVARTGPESRARDEHLAAVVPISTAVPRVSAPVRQEPAPVRDLGEHVRRVIVAQVMASLDLAASEIHEEDAFADYGVDSIVGVSLIQDLNAALGVTMVTTDLFDHGSVKRLAAHVAATYPDRITALLAADVPASAPAPVAVAEQVEDLIVTQLQRSLDLDRAEIGVEDSFRDYGVDSILAVRLVQDLNAALGIALAATDLFDHRSVRALARHVAEHHVVALPAADPAAVVSYESTVDVEPVVAPTPSGEPNREPVAIIGMSGRYGRAEDVNQLWEHLVAGDDLVGEVTRWDMARHRESGADTPARGAFLNDIDLFDPMFFAISGVEATYMDPQQRVVLEESWKALEDAGYAGPGTQGRDCGVYIGTQVSDYLPAEPLPGAPAQAMWGNAESVIPARVSYFLDLRGPAISVDTACSSSLVAVHLACQALRAGEVELALVGGVSVQCAPGYYLSAEKAGMLSSTGRCATFDDRADGFVPGEGVGVVVLKRLSDAVADGDHIHGVIGGSGVNQDGTSNGITAPSAKSQEQLERSVYDTYGVNPADLDLVEAHGTGTKLGDPIEFTALTRAFRAHTDKTGYCAIGSIKTNIGHTATAAGTAGLIKVLLSLRHQAIPPSLHFERGNSHIDFEGSPFYVNTVHRDWPETPGRPRLAALSSFGFSGTNAHVVIAEAPRRERTARRAPGQLIVLSALSHQQLREQAQRLVAHLDGQRDLAVGDVGLTLLQGRRRCPVRLALVVRDTGELSGALASWLAGAEDVVRVADLSEHTPRPQTSLAQFGEDCLRQCAEGVEETAYLRNLEVARDLFLQGYELDYGLLFAEGGHGRIPLPTYPFARERYWVPEEHQVLTAPRPATVSTTTGAEPEHVALAPYWVRDTEWADDTAEPTGPVLVVGGGTDVVPTAGVIAVEDLAAATAALRRGTVEHIVWFAPAADGGDTAALPARVDAGAVALFEHVKVLLELGYGGRELGLTVVTRQTQPVLGGEPVHPADAAVLGLAGVIANEYPDWTVRALDVGTGDEVPSAALFGPGGVRALRNGQWFRRRLARTELAAQPSVGYRHGGVYVVLGGAGGLGEVWTEDVVRRFQARVVWIGRRAEDAAIRAKLDRLGALGPRPVYLSADAADEAALTTAYGEIKERFGAVDGVVQSVFGVVDLSLANTSREQFRRGLEAKVAASVRMAQVFGGEPLDFMLFFSSIASFSQTMGYCSYVAGNMFEDALAHRLGADRPYPVKVVNWGYWGAVGSGVDVPAHVRDRFYQQGFGDIDPALGMAAVQRLLAAPVTQLAYLSITDPGRFADYAAADTVRVLAPAAGPTEAITPGLPARDEAVHTAQTRVKSELRALDATLAAALAAALQRAGWLTGPIDAATLKRRHGVLDKYDRWLTEGLRSLAEHGHLVASGSGTYTAVPVDVDQVSARWANRRDEWLANRDVRASATLVDRILPELTDILTGRTSAVDIVFPGSSLEFVEGIYKYNTIADHFNDVVGDCVVALVQRRLAQDPAARVRVLEIGAGTGGTTATLLPRLRPYADRVEEYCYTDLSRAFLIHGAQQFGPDAPYLRCEIFNAGLPVAEQGFDEGGYDLVVATNVLHATEDIRASLRNGKALLRPGGAVVVNEIAGYTVFGLLTFGLLDGWWLYDDVELREPGGPGLTPAMWRSVLEWEGFTGVEFPARDAHSLGQQVIVGYSDGVLRQERAEDRAPVTEPDAPAAAPVAARGPVDDATLRSGIAEHVRAVVAKTLMLPAESVGVREPLSAYGIDSILILQLTNALKKDLGEIGSTLFFEFRTIEALAEHFVATKREIVAALVAPGQVEEPTVPVAGPARPAVVRAEPEPALTGAIAVIGMSARFPQAPDLDAYWANLRSGTDCVTEVPADRWSLESFYEPDRERAAATGRSYAKWGGFVDGFADFDPLFFEIPPAEAIEMDPQERLFLQEAWKAFEDAGYTRARLARDFDGQVGVFAGVTRVGHNLYGPPRWRAGDTAYPFTSFASVANRVSFKLNLTGPSMPIDTMCSSSLTALHEACEHLLRGECAVALTGGVNLYLHPSSFVNLANLGMLSDEGKCRSFGNGGNGFVPGEGVGALVLKRLADAERDGDHIHAVIRGTAVNHGGTTNGYTVPNPVAQGKVVRRALDRAGVDARTVGYVEAHGTGTALGDPIEIAGLTKAFADDTADVRFCAIGSSKTNIGHAEAAAGIAGVCKVLLQLRHRELAPSLHADELNPHIDFAATPFQVQRELAPWQPVLDADGRELPRRAGVSSFGAGGANAHVVIEEYVRGQVRETVPTEGPAVVVLSARDADRLTENASALLDWLGDERNRSVPLRDIAYTLHIGREPMPERLGVVVTSTAELADRLRDFVHHPDTATGLLRGRVTWDNRGRTVDEDLAEVVRTWLAKGKHGKALELWVDGLEVDWAPLYSGARPSVVPLPTYSFAKERYWIADRDIPGGDTSDVDDPDTLIDAVLDDYLNDSLDADVAVQRLRLSLGAAGGHPSNNGSR